MKQVKVSLSTLLEKVKVNRKEHQELFLKAQKGFREAVIVELSKMLDEAKNGQEIRRSVHLAEPVDYTENYDRVIAMLEMSTESQVVLDMMEFDQYVLDNWSWKKSAFATNSSYLAK